MGSRFKSFLTIKRFGADLLRELSQFEQNVRDKLESDNARAFGPFVPTELFRRSFRAGPWQFCRISPAATMRVILPSPREPDAGWICLKNVGSSTNTIEVVPIGGTVDFATSITMTSAYESVILVPDRESNNWCAIRGGSGSSVGLGNPYEVLTTDAAGTALDWALIVNANVDAAAAIAVSKLAAGNDLDILRTIGATPTWVPPNGIGFWEQLLFIDCAAEANQAFATSGTPVTFGGVSWTPQNVSGGGDNGAIDNVNGTGLQFAHNGNSSTMNGTPTALRLQLDLRQLGPLGDLTDGPIRVRVRVTLSPFANNFQFFYAGFTLISLEAQNILAAIGYNSGDGGQTTTGLVQHGGVSADYFLNPAARGSNDVIEARFKAPWTLSARFGAYSSGWPTISDAQGTIVSLQSSDGGNDAYVQQRDTTLGAGAGNTGLRIVLAAATNAVGVTFTATVTHIEIEQWRNGSNY